MKRIILLLTCVLCLGAYAAGGPPNAVSPSHVSQNTVDSLRQELNALQQSYNNLNMSLVEHRSKESFYSDIIGTNASWFLCIIGLLAGVMGLIGWNKYRAVATALKETEADLQKQFETIVAQHKAEETEVFKNLEKDRIGVRTDVGNLYAVLGDTMTDNEMTIVLNIFSLTNDIYNKDYFATLSSEMQQKMIKEDEEQRALLARLQHFDKIIDKWISNGGSLDEQWYKELSSLEFADDTPKREEITSKLSSILYKMETYFKQHPDKLVKKN